MMRTLQLNPTLTAVPANPASSAVPVSPAVGGPVPQTARAHGAPSLGAQRHGIPRHAAPRPEPPPADGGVLAEIAPISLAELIERAALQTRTDRKYVLPRAEVAPFLAALVPYARVLEIDGIRSFAYESVYFDTPELTSYLLTARRRRRRFKIRTRTYLDSHQCWLEVKTPGARGSTVKHRLPYQPHDRTTLAPGRHFVDEVLTRERFAGPEMSFAPSLLGRYWRSTLFLPATSSRVTIDTGLMWEDSEQELFLPDLAVVETKTAAAASDVDRLLWQQGHRPARISKYATGLAALRPELPATPWRRTMRRHFAARPAADPRPFRWLPAS